jgi:hypothetical protein
MDNEHVPVRTIEPGQDEEVVTGPDALQRFQYVGLESDPGIRRTLIALPGSGLQVSQRRLDPTDCSQLEGQRYGRVIQSMSGCA